MKLLVFGADYCGSCNFMKNEVLPLLGEHSIEYEYVDGMREPQRAKNWNIQNIPYIICFNEDEEVEWQHPGFMSLDEILNRCEINGKPKH